MKAGVDEFAIKEAEGELGAVFSAQLKELFKLVNNLGIGDWILYPIKGPSNLKKRGTIL